jgi:branched-chain amino acid aminotransferase
MDVYYVNDCFVQEQDALISVNDLSVLRGYGVFDFLRTYNGYPFHLSGHIDRLERSAKLLGIALPCPKEEIAKLVREALSRSTHPERKVRIVISGGISPDGMTPGDNQQLLLMVTAADKMPEHWYSKGAKIITSHQQRFMPGSKSVNYIPAILSQREARNQQAIEAVFVDKDGYLLEGTSSNLFVFIGKTLITPPCERILPGITREVVLELASKEFTVVERKIHKEEIPLFEEAFITSSIREVVPVTAIDSHKMGESVGVRCSRIVKMFADYTSSYNDQGC